MRLEDLMERAAQYDENLARDIKDYVHGRKYGLVYEASKPEFVRMWKKPVVRGDIVNILPPRGVIEDTKNDDDPSESIYKVIAIYEGVATLRNEQSNETVTASVDDIVALARFDKPIYAGLKETGRVERGGDKPYHVVINGENYHALQTLVYAYQGKVDCIYIDPPYNGEQKDWKYNNNYVSKDDVYKHSKWLTFIEDRLKLAKKLLNPKESVLIVTIDEKEYLRLGLLLEQEFSGKTIQMVSTVINPKGSVKQGLLTRCDEYIYFVFIGDGKITGSKTDFLLEKSKKETVRWPSLKRTGSNSRRSVYKSNAFYPIFYNTETGKFDSIGSSIQQDASRHSIKVPQGLTAVWPIDSNGDERIWQLVPEKLNEYYRLGYVRFGKLKNGQASPYYVGKKLREQIESGEVVIAGRDEDGAVQLEYRNRFNTINPKTVWNVTAHSASEHGTNLLQQFLGQRKFPYPKSLYAVEDTLRLVVGDKPNALIVDFFAGSGTTAHAIMRLNHQDGGHRRSISVSNNEVSAREERDFAIKHIRQGDDLWEERGIAHYITWPRVVAAITGKTPDGKEIEGDYGVNSEVYREIEADVFDPSSGKKIRERVYRKIKAKDDLVPDSFPISDGFEENAVFFDLEYLEPSVVSADLAFDRIAPILWLCGGCQGEILQRRKGYVIGWTYAVLFDPRYKTRFIEAVTERKRIKTVFIVTDAAERYRTLCAELPDCRVMQLYESYLRSFEINAIG